MESTCYYILKDLYQQFYAYCISGRDEERNNILKLDKLVKEVSSTALTYIYKIVRFADGMEREKSRPTCLNAIKEGGMVIQEPFDLYCYYSILELVYTYIYPDANKLKDCQKKIGEYENCIDDSEKRSIAQLRTDFNMADYKIKKHIKNEKTMKDAYSVTLTERDFRLQKRSFLMILKGFSSSTPFFYPALKGKFYNSPIKGGGFFLRWKDTGIAVDPGINFMENMHMNGLGSQDINAVIVTHDHIDHNGDLMIIDDFAAQFEQKDIKLYADKNTISSAAHYEKLKNTHTLDSDIVGGFCLGDKKEIKLEFLSTKHILKGEESGAAEYQKDLTFALKIILLEGTVGVKTIGITSDTEYFPALANFFSDCDIIIANISETNEADYNQGKRKTKHLGYAGCAELIQACNKKAGKLPYYIISEFWAGKGDVRCEIVRRLRENTGYTNIYPGDIGMLFFLDQPTFLCEHCGCETDINELHLVREVNDYGRILTICENCLL